MTAKLAKRNRVRMHGKLSSKEKLMQNINLIFDKVHSDKRSPKAFKLRKFYTNYARNYYTDSQIWLNKKYFYPKQLNGNYNIKFICFCFDKIFFNIELFILIIHYSNG